MKRYLVSWSARGMVTNCRHSGIETKEISRSGSFVFTVYDNGPSSGISGVLDPHGVHRAHAWVKQHINGILEHEYDNGECEITADIEDAPYVAEELT